MYPECLRIGSFAIYWYGVFVAAGVLLSGSIFQRQSLKQGYSPQLVSSLLFWLIVWGLIGGRFLHIVVHAPYYYRRPFDIIRIRNGGLAIEGAVISALIFVNIYSRIKRFNLREMLDIIALATPLGQAIGRIGCFFNGCCYGRPTEFFTGVRFPFSPDKLHPTELYYSALYIVLFIFLRELFKRRLKPGIVFSFYLLGFAFIRYVVDILRGDLVLTFVGLYATQIIALVLFIIGIGWLISILSENR
ncbi:MAG: prolipoprotein diacylglyceryl transferase [Elusimicrobia bacterium]|nr:prolipoprotein diacylglyceryl transferase [Elusimicrobiota bacterium]